MEQTLFPEAEVRAPGRPAVISAGLAGLPTVSPWDLTHHPENPRRHPKRNLEKIRESLAEHGQQTPLVIQRSTGYVCKGNGTLMVIRDVLGWDRVAVSYEDFDDDQALRYLIADNEASASAENDKEHLGRLLKRMSDSAKGLTGTLFDLDEAETIWAEIGDITIVDPGQFRGGYAETPEELAQRAAKLEKSGPALREVVLALKPEDYETFALAVSKLSRAYGTKGVIATVMEAIKRAADQVVG